MRKKINTQSSIQVTVWFGFVTEVLLQSQFILALLPGSRELSPFYHS